MTVWLDYSGLAPSPELARLYVQQLELRGSALDEEHRLEVLLSHKWEKGDEVITGPEGKDFWLLVPGFVPVTVVPDGRELPRNKRCQTILEWQLRIRGVTAAQAKKWTAKGPTPRHSDYNLFEDARVAATTFVIEGHVDEWTPEQVGAEVEMELPYEYVCVQEPKEFTELIARLHVAVAEGKMIGIDVEADTPGKRPDPRHDVLVGIGFSFDEHHNYYLPFNGKLARTGIFEALRYVRLDKLLWAGWNAGYDCQVIRNAIFDNKGLDLRPAAGDGQCAAMILQRTTRDLKNTVKEMYDYRMETFGDVIKGAGASVISEVPVEDVAEYCCADAFFGLKATRDLEEKIANDPQPSQTRLYSGIEMPVHGILVDMTECGLPLDVKGVLEYHIEIEKKLEMLRRAIQEETKDATFNPNTPAEVAHVLHEKRGLPIQGLTDLRKPSVDKKALLRLRPMEPYLVQLLIMWRHWTKIDGTFLKPWMLKHETRRLVTLWKQYRTATGRLSSEDPNLMQLPLELREFIRFSEGMLCVADYDQLEMRIAAWLSGDEVMLDVYRRGGDIHDETCVRTFGLRPGEGKTDRPEIRVAAKAVNFAGMLYGAGGLKIVELVEKQALANPELRIDIPTISEASTWLKDNEKTYPGYTEYKKRVIDFARDRG